ncbi:MAG: YlmC/YmxH family sporulation protein [Peptococcaceae bacterium]|nr:YlmC/YmxH family sporulation protein [Peptococcaceae bacterium]MBQ5369021.1 YlmC/YmxH family sporulation protein [Peptococcaceae bacterium]MBQ5615143.1 YlmC/YmxH family sporulation protein [Peptococcaceae bacterium]MBQ5659177.1 YlmC/YmxH family sporulation protein [Peptococcaceae bacterium]MBQ5707840.1 YlmC/YmxH family sporulation protein [Peptococcaceae bacterium]
MTLMERQVVNIADGKCLGNLKDIELNLWTGSIEALILPALNGFWHRLQNAGELVIGWEKVVRIGVDVILIDAPELSQYDTVFQKGRRKRTQQDNSASPLWQQEVEAYQEELDQNNIILLHRDDYREL